MSDTLRDDLVASVADEYAAIRAKHAGGASRSVGEPLARARRNRLAIDWTVEQPPRPNQIGLQAFDDYDLTPIAAHIDWTPFFRTWELKGTYPAILTDAKVGEAARGLYDDAQAMLKRIIDEKWLRARGIIGLFPANTQGDDVEVYTDETRGKVATRFHFLRQQMKKRQGRPNLCLADFVAPKESGVADYIGAFAVTAGLGIDEKVAAFEAAHDDYSAILLKALADRLAEAFTEHLHVRVRTDFWGYAAGENLDNSALIAEAYQGIRPAPGYPACPEHSEKGGLFELLGAETNASMILTESFAMLPAASVAGFYFSHPQASYFGLGRIARDQVADYAKRKGVGVEQGEKWLAPNLAYER
jgi:5-methyltetrahydrofolate--homocysteine methyltransferase